MSILQSVFILCNHLIIFLLLCIAGSSSDASPITPLTTTVLPALSERYDQVLVQPCGSNVPVAPSTVEGNITAQDLKQMLGVTKRLKRNLDRLKMNYSRQNVEICSNSEVMNLQRKYFGSYCQIPSSSVSTSEDLSKSMMLTTKWLFWVSKAEQEIVNSVSPDKRIAPSRFESLANFSKESLCALKTQIQINETQVNEVIACQLPTVSVMSDPGDIIPVTCEVLDQLSGFVSKIRTSLCGLYSHIKPCSLRKRAIKLRKKNKKKNKGRKNKGKKQRRKNKKNKKGRKNKGERKRKGKKGKGKQNKAEKRKTKKRQRNNRSTTSSPQ